MSSASIMVRPIRWSAWPQLILANLPALSSNIKHNHDLQGRAPGHNETIRLVALTDILGHMTILNRLVLKSMGSSAWIAAKRPLLSYTFNFLIKILSYIWRDNSSQRKHILHKSCFGLNITSLLPLNQFLPFLKKLLSRYISKYSSSLADLQPRFLSQIIGFSHSVQYPYFPSISSSRILTG